MVGEKDFSLTNPYTPKVLKVFYFPLFFLFESDIYFKRANIYISPKGRGSYRHLPFGQVTPSQSSAEPLPFGLMAGSALLRFISDSDNQMQRGGKKKQKTPPH